MEQKSFLELHRALCQSARELSESKGHDYSGEEDTLANLKRTESLGIASAPAGVLVRQGDKLSRAAELITEEAHVEDETLVDTALDGMNYWILLVALLGDRGELQSDTLDELMDGSPADSNSGGGVDQEDPSDVSAAHEAQRLKDGKFYLEENVNVRGMSSGTLKELTVSLVAVEPCLCGGAPKLLSNPGPGEEVWWLQCRECETSCPSHKTLSTFADSQTMVASIQEMARSVTFLWNDYMLTKKEGDDE